jgi:hypothetical protein
MREREPMPLCGEHGEAGISLMGGKCEQCGRDTNAVYVMCGWCAVERNVCVLDGKPMPPVE